VRDAERTRAAIMDAALVEFGEHGYAGARTSAIARRAGVNAQLISYYFDGKEGLYKALAQRWRGESDALLHGDLPLAEVVAGFVRANLTSRSMTRLLVWEGLTGTGMDDTDVPYFAQMVADVRRRQERGEIAADLDPTAVLLALFSAALAPTLLPHVVERVTGQAADSPEFLDDYASRLAQIVERLGP
jgi:TetR/AcrR family transcriptional regulator